MFSDSTLIDAGLKRWDGVNENPLSCTFWTRSDRLLSLQLFNSPATTGYQPHSHAEYVITVCLAGRLVRQQFAHTHRVLPGAVVISNPGIPHDSEYEVHGAPAVEAVSLMFDRRILVALAEELGLPPVSKTIAWVFTGSIASAVVHRCALDIAAEMKQRAVACKIILESLAMRLLGETLRAWPSGHIVSVPLDAAPRLSPRDFIRAYEFMRSCRKEFFRLEHLGKFMGISEENFTRLFSATAGCPPAAFYNRMLLQRGSELLRHSKLTIKEISFALGFKTSSHFILAFRREFALSPEKYRTQIIQRTGDSLPPAAPPSIPIHSDGAGSRSKVMVPA